MVRREVLFRAVTIIVRPVPIYAEIERILMKDLIYSTSVGLRRRHECKYIMYIRKLMYCVVNHRS